MVEPNEELRAARLARPSPTLAGEPMSRAELAEAVNAELWRVTGKSYALDGHAIARYERGAVRWPSAAYRSALRTVLGVDADAEIGFRPTRRGESAAAAPAGGGEPVPAGAAPADYRTALLAVQGVDRARGAAAALSGVLGVVERIGHDLRDARAADRAQLLAVGALAAEFAGFLHRDLGDPDRSLRCHDLAMEWAQQAQDTPMQAFVLLRKAQAAYDVRDAPRMLSLARAARATATAAVAGLRAEILQQVARAEAMLGAPDAEVLGALDAARALADAGAADRGGGEPGSGYTAALLDVQTAICFTELGRPRDAADRFRAVLAGPDHSPRDLAYFRMLLATALALSGEPDEAAATGLSSLPVAVGSRSRRTLREARTLCAALRPWSGRGAVRELYDAVATAGG